MQDATEGMASSAAAALVTTMNRAPLIIGDIAESAGLTHSATVRLVDRLEREGLVRRQERQGRTVLVDITPLGRQRALEIVDARNQAAAAFISLLDEDEIELLESFIHRILANTITSPQSARRISRFCRLDQCEIVTAALLDRPLRAGVEADDALSPPSGTLFADRRPEEGAGGGAGQDQAESEVNGEGTDTHRRDLLHSDTAFSWPHANSRGS